MAPSLPSPRHAGEVREAGSAMGAIKACATGSMQGKSSLMITLYKFGPAFGLPDPNPFVMKVETLLISLPG